MTRGVGESELVEALPDVVVSVAAVATQLGDMWFVLVAVGAVYAAGRAGIDLVEDPRRDCLYLFALAIGAYGLTAVFKVAFAYPRPPGADVAEAPGGLPTVAELVYVTMATAEGYGFPSGHALKTTAVYGGAVGVLTWGSRRVRAAGAAAVVVLVSLSRVVLGVHYLVDVVVGVALGAVFLAVMSRAAGRGVTPPLVLTTGLGLLAFALAVDVRSALAAAVAVLGLVAALLTEVRPGATGQVE